MTDQTLLPIAESPPTTLGRASLLVRLVTLGLIVIPLLGLVAAPFFLCGGGGSRGSMWDY